jgi:hypothetical protein
MRIEPQLVELPDRGDRERIAVEIVDRLAFQDDRADEGIVQTARQR